MGVLDARLNEKEAILAALTTHEEAYVFCPDGSLLYHKRATPGQELVVTFEPSEVVRMRGCVLTHNHPNGSAFSDPDLRFAYGNGLAEIRVVGVRNGRLYRLAATSEHPFTAETYNDLV